MNAKVTLEAARGVRAGHAFVWRSALTQPPKGAKVGDVVPVVDPQGNFVAQAMWAEKSPIALRVVSRHPAENERIDQGFFRERLEAAVRRREAFAGRDAYRVVHAEADLLPGLLVDRYADVLVLQTLSEGMDQKKREMAQLLLELTGCTRALCRDDASGRDFEGLPREKVWLVGGGETMVEYHEGPAKLRADLWNDAKTGSFLDQVDNHVRAGELAKGRGLDAFSYHGGFALALARKCTQVLALEQDEGAAARATQNVALNGATNVEVRQANAFDVLRELERAKEKFETVVVDPPGLAKRKEGLAAAERAYRELNLRAMKLLAPGGVLVTCSCSGKLGREKFEALVLEAAQDAKRSLQVLERRGAGADHPPLFGVPETEYLKVLVLRAVP